MMSPSIVAPGVTSCIRFKHRMSVDLPQPEGPMMAVIFLSKTCRRTSRMTGEPP